MMKACYCVISGSFGMAGLITLLRQRQELLADLQAQVAANQVGVKGLQRLVECEGEAVVQQQMDTLQQQAADCVMRLVDRLEEADFQLELDNDGAILAVHISINCLHRRLKLDFSGTSRQQENNFNAPLAVTKAVVLYIVRTLLDTNIPLNDDCFIPIDLEVPSGCLLNPRYPAAVAAGNVEVSQSLCNLLLAALGIIAAIQGTMNNFTFGDGQFQYYETVAGGGGAGQGFDGSDGLQSHMTNSRLTDPEVLERQYPVHLERFAFRQDSGGSGTWCGGSGLMRKFRFLEPMSVL
ncbi:hydantoinase [cyanobiont of Ornithocercus magnificus]|nr:hydantoinase [cyanobiont of Ornithocercus magnificus]